MMNLTNKHGLPASLVSILQNDTYRVQIDDPALQALVESGDHISVTSLIKGEKEAELQSRHYREVERDVTDRIWTLEGQAWHAMFESTFREMPHVMVELRSGVVVDGYAITGQCDLYNSSSGQLVDFKRTSVSKAGKQKEHEIQLNLNAYLIRKQRGLPVKSLEIWQLFRDWKKTLVRDGYPDCAFKTVPYEMWSDSDCESYIAEKVRRRKQCEGLEDDEIKECSKSERWQSSTKILLFSYKKGSTELGAKPCKVAYSMEEIESYKAANSHYKDQTPKIYAPVQYSEGKPVKCLGYCDVAQFCHFGRAAIEKYGAN